MVPFTSFSIQLSEMLSNVYFVLASEEIYGKIETSDLLAFMCTGCLLFFIIKLQSSFY